jgi:hypothetical protein
MAISPSAPNSMKINQAVQKLLVGDTQTDNHFGMIEVTFNAVTIIPHPNPRIGSKGALTSEV